MTDLKERLREHATDWNGHQMPDLEPAKGDPTAGTLRAAADRISALEAQLAEARDLFTRLEPHLDAIVCFASTIDEFEPNGLRRDVRAFLTPQKPCPRCGHDTDSKVHQWCKEKGGE